LSHKLEVGERR